MSYPVQAGTPSYSGTFIPEIWSSKLQVKFYDATVLSAISNTDYEGEIKNQGDKVKIRTIPSIVINDYASGQTLTNQRPESPNVELLIDKGKYWSTIIDDVQEVQADINQMNIWSNDASEQLKIAVDSDVLGGIAPDVDATNKGATAGRLSGNINLGTTGAPVILTKVNIIDYIIDLGLVLDENNIPESDRYLLLPAWASAMLKKSDLKDASLTGDNVSVMRNGRLGMLDRFTLYNTNLLPSVVDGAAKATTFFAGHKAGLTFASQITKTETLRAESTFGDIMRGLNIYGYEVIKPTAIASLYAVKG